MSCARVPRTTRWVTGLFGPTRTVPALPLRARMLLASLPVSPRGAAAFISAATGPHGLEQDRLALPRQPALDPRQPLVGLADAADHDRADHAANLARDSSAGSSSWMPTELTTLRKHPPWMRGRQTNLARSGLPTGQYAMRSSRTQPSAPGTRLHASALPIITRRGPRALPARAAHGPRSAAARA